MGLIGGLKLFAVLAIISALGYGVKWTYDKHLDAVDTAVNVALLEAAQERQVIVNNVTETFRKQNEQDREEFQRKLNESRREVSDLRRMLLIEHDLDRLLQEKPGLILPRVNNGTEEVLKELEELTQ